MIIGVDVSSYLEQIKLAQSKYKYKGQEIDPFLILKNNGVTHIRTRLWVDPYDENKNPYLAGTCDLVNFINLTNKLKPYGFKYILDFHYSDFWCDPSKQFTPKAWQNLSYEELLDKVYTYTKETLLEIKKHNIELDFIQTGNEITHGILWPYGQIQYNENKESSYTCLASILKQARRGIKEIYPNSKVIIHLEQSYDKELYEDYISHLLNNGLEIDVLGSSYYPFWHRSFDEYFSNMRNVKEKFNIEVMNVEFGYPYTLEDYLDNNDKESHLVISKDNEEEYKKILPYPISIEGQKDFVKKFIELARKNNFLGVCYWEPLWIPGEGICWASIGGQKYQNLIPKETRNDWANQCLFDYNGNILPAFMELKDEK